MEDVVLHYQSGSADGLSSLLERAEKLLEPFPCRTPPVFKPWFPTATADHRLPIRPAKPAPVINPPGELLDSDSRSHTPATVTQSLTGNEVQKPNTDKLIPEKICDRTRAESPPEKPQNGKEYFCISETPNDYLPTSLRHKPERGVTRLSPNKPPQKDKDGVTVIHSPVKRSWSVFTQGGVLLQSSQSLSKPFHHVVSVHRLHLRQRAKWVINQNNCGSAGDIEQVWRTLSRSIQRSQLPTCNANIQRDRAEIWVFCDVLYSEQVGHFLKDELQLSGRISMSVRRLGSVFSM